MENINLQNISNELELLKKQIRDIKANMVDRDAILTPDEESVLNEGLRELEQSETISLEDFKKEMSENVQD